MWCYEKRLQYPVNIKEPNAKIAQVIMSQYGGPDGELGASMRYLSQRYSMPYNEVAAILTDIGTEASEMLRRTSVVYFSFSSQETPMVFSGMATPKLSAMVAPITAKVSGDLISPLPSMDLEYAKNGTISRV